MSELKTITDLFRETESRLAAGAWPDFLRTAGHNYKYDFPSQVLIYAQMPAATACADMDTWNKKLHRQVREDAVMIALLQDLGTHLDLRYVFDLSDTISPYGHKVPLWEMTPEKEPAVRTAMAEAFLSQESEIAPNTPTDFYRTVANALLSDNESTLSARVEKLREHSPGFRSLSSAESYKRFRAILLASVTAAVMHRCGLNPQLPQDAFLDLNLLQDTNILASIGQSMQEYTKQCLDVAAIAVRVWDKMHEEEKDHGKHNLSQDRSISPSGADNAGAADVESVRNAAKDISETDRSRSIYGASDAGRAGTSSAGGRGGDPAPGGSSDAAPSSERSGSKQSIGSGRLGSTQKQTEASGRGNDLSGNDLSVSAVLPTPDEQLQIIHHFADNSQFIQEELDSILTDDLNGRIDRVSILSAFQNNPSALEAQQILRKIYGTFQTEHLLPNGKTGIVHCNSLGLTLENGEQQNTFTWSEIAERIRYLVADNRFLITDASLPENSSKLKPGQKIILSVGTAYVVLRAGEDTVTLQDAENPTFTKEMPRQVLEVVLRNQKTTNFRKANELYSKNQDFESVKEGNSGTVKLSSYTENLAIPEQNGAISVVEDTSVSDYFAMHFNTAQAEKNYTFLSEYAPEIIDGTLDYIRFESDVFEPLYIERISENEIAIAHTYVENGDLFLDPEVTFHIDEEHRRLYPLSYEQNAVGFYERVLNETTEGILQPDPIQEREINLFCTAWFQNLRWQEHQPTRGLKQLDTGDLEYTFSEERELLISGNSGIEPIKTSQMNEDTKKLSKNRSIRENYLREILLLDRLVFHNISETKAFFDSTADLDRRIDYLKERYGEAYTNLIAEDGSSIGFHVKDNGLEVWEGNYITSDTKQLLLWQDLCTRLDLLLREAPLPESVPYSEPELPYPVQSAPHVDAEGRLNFRVSDMAPHYGGPKVRFAQNLTAIQLLKQLEREGRLADADEQVILQQYVGWGGLSQAFDPDNEDWHEEYEALKSLLTEEEYTSARESTLTAFYTPPVVTEAIYRGLYNLGFRRGNLLDPCCGTGNFFGMLPESMTQMKLHGVELDSLSGRISCQLYQQANIAISGYESISLPDSLYDVAVGNVPFGNYQLPDRRYDKYHFLIHDYFVAKTLDKVRPGGVIAFITSRGTMDKQNDSVRRYIAQRADLLGAVRMPDGIFRENAGTDAGADILFLRKRDRPMLTAPDWLNVTSAYIPKTKTFLPRINQYFKQHPEMVLGDLEEVSGPFGPQLKCSPRAGEDLQKMLHKAVDSITKGHSLRLEELDSPVQETRDCIPADPSVRNYSYAFVNGDIYFREDSVMYRMPFTGMVEKRVKGMVEIRDITRSLIEAQTRDDADEVIFDLQERLNTAYDTYTKKYGLLNSLANSRAFSDDASYYLLCSLEHIDEKGTFLGKADMFFKRTIGRHEPVPHTDTAFDALAVSMGEFGKVDLPYMCALYGKSQDEILAELDGVVFPVPGTEDRYAVSSIYLSGNIREKLAEAEVAAKEDPRFQKNVEALKRVLPEPLPPSLISVRLGAPWVPAEDVTQFMYELLSPDSIYQEQNIIRVVHSEVNNSWSIVHKSWDKNNVLANATYGTKEANAYKLLEDALNGRDTRIYSADDDADHPVLDTAATFAAQDKQRIIKERFTEWIWQDPERRDRLCKIYNERFNSIVPPSYNANMVKFVGMNPSITLEEHQKECVARILYGGNTQLAHEVGAGKTWTMVAAAMEGKRLGLCHKSMVVVPNHLVSQWASDIYELYPAANVLASTEKDFEMANRKKFCSRIATGDYDIVVIGHSQFEKIPLSKERQEESIRLQIKDIVDYIEKLKDEGAEKFTVKQLEAMKKNLDTRLRKLLTSKKRDDVVTFEELGVDRLFIDESHEFKNLFLYTKMRNVAGINQTDAQKASDLFIKCRYMDELTGNMGNIHATGTPISNTMAELYTTQRYLQFDLLKELGLDNFDAWAATFGETIQALELAPEGQGLRIRTRFAKFYNVPELMHIYKLVADIRTKEVLNLPVPQACYHTVPVPASDAQKTYVSVLGSRAMDIRKGGVDPRKDNMLWITNDGRKLALDQRLIDPTLPDNPNSKANACADRILNYYREGMDKKVTQLVFCDLSTPKADGSFSVYTDLKEKLVLRGIPEDEIHFIHEAKNTKQKEAMFARVRSGDVRVLMGSTGKMGTGTNVQDRLCAIHDLDCPYRPSDLEQRAGRGLRRGNTNELVNIDRYVTEGTFDAYMYQLMAIKQRFSSQVFTNKEPARVITDMDEISLSYAEIMALTTGDPRIMEKVTLESEISRLQILKSQHDQEQYRLDQLIRYTLQPKIRNTEDRILKLRQDIAFVSNQPKHETNGNDLLLHSENSPTEDPKEAGEVLLQEIATIPAHNKWIELGTFRGFTLKGLKPESHEKMEQDPALPRLSLCGSLDYPVEYSGNFKTLFRRMHTLLDRNLQEILQQEEQFLARYRRDLVNARAECGKQFSFQTELDEKVERLAALEKELDIDSKNQDALTMTSVPAFSDISGNTRGLDAIIAAAVQQNSNQPDVTNRHPLPPDHSLQ